MKKKYPSMFVFGALFFATISIVKGWVSPYYLLFWLGGAVGIFLPDVDHLIHSYFLRPHEYNSKRVVGLVQEKQLRQGLDYMLNTSTERKNLIFHSSLFQIVFIVFAFFIITSSSSLFGRGLVLAFFMHLLLDQIGEFTKTNSINGWFHNFSISLDRQRSALYLTVMVVILFTFGFLL